MELPPLGNAVAAAGNPALGLHPSHSAYLERIHPPRGTAAELPQDISIRIPPALLPVSPKSMGPASSSEHRGYRKHRLKVSLLPGKCGDFHRTSKA